MSNFIFPTPVHNISDDFAAHVARGSVNPGLDFAAAFGDLAYAVADGIVVVADSSMDGPGGRILGINFDDGHHGWYMHLSELLVQVGERVLQGQPVAHTGASAHGSEYNTSAPYLHFSLRYPGSGGEPVDPLPLLHSIPVPLAPAPAVANTFVTSIQEVPPMSPTPVTQFFSAVSPSGVVAPQPLALEVPAQDLGVVIESPATRKMIYGIYVVATIVATGVQVAYSALQSSTPGWLSATIAVLAYLSIPIVGLARANAPK